MTTQVRRPSTMAVDGGYAWVVLAASLVAQCVSIGICLGAIGVMTASFGEQFPTADSSALSWFGSLQGCWISLSSLVVVPLSDKVGGRAITIGGSLLAASGFVASIFVTDLWPAYITYGFIPGVGISGPYLISMTILETYFDKLRNVAFPVVAIGQGIGLMTFPRLTELILANYGHTYALTFLSCCMSLTLACGVVFRSNSAGKRMKEPVTASSAATAVGLREGSGHSPVYAPALPSEVPLLNGRRGSTDSPPCQTPSHDSPPKVTDRPLPDDGDNDKGCVRRPPAMFQLLRRWLVWALILNSALWGLCSSATEALMPSLGIARGLSPATAALGATLAGAGFLASSALIMALGKKRYDRYLLYLLSSALFGSCVALVPVYLTEESYLTLFTLYGWWIGMVVSLFMGVLSQSVAAGDFSALVGFYNLMSGVGYFVGPIAVGTLQDVAGDVAAWCFGGGSAVAASLIIIPSYVSQRKQAITKRSIGRDAFRNEATDDKCGRAAATPAPEADA